jgi:hypothetical protein
MRAYRLERCKQIALFASLDRHWAPHACTIRPTSGKAPRSHEITDGAQRAWENAELLVAAKVQPATEVAPPISDGPAQENVSAPDDRGHKGEARGSLAKLESLASLRMIAETAQILSIGVRQRGVAHLVRLLLRFSSALL